MSKWIDIKECKPYLGQRILVYYSYPDTREGIHIRNCTGNEDTQLITHWMPLPSAPLNEYNCIPGPAWATSITQSPEVFAAQQAKKETREEKIDYMAAVRNMCR